jgi:hypothetical protein
MRAGRVNSDPLERVIKDLEWRAEGRGLAQELFTVSQRLTGSARLRAILEGCLVLHGIDPDDDVVFSTINSQVEALAHNYLRGIVYRRGEAQARRMDAIDHSSLMAVSLFVLGFEDIASTYVHDRAEYDRRVTAGRWDATVM